MSQLVGVVLSLGALLSWGFGNHQIQRATRAIGVWRSLFFVSLVGFLAFFPFVWAELLAYRVEKTDILLILAIGFVTILASLSDLMALKLGKLSIVSPLDGLELPITIAIGMLIAGQTGVSYPIMALMALVLVGVIMSALSGGGLEQNHRFEDGSYAKTRLRFERGMLFGILSAIGLAVTNVLIGYASVQTSPLMTLWLSSGLLLVSSLVYLLITRQLGTLVDSLAKHPLLIMTQSMMDNLGWIFYAYATLALPLVVVTTISQGYIILAVILGFVLNREKVQPHQKVGIALAIAAILSIAYIFGQG